MAILKELVANDLVDPDYISISERHTNNYQLQIKTKHNRIQLEAFCKKNNCTIEEDKEERTPVIFKPL